MIVQVEVKKVQAVLGGQGSARGTSFFTAQVFAGEELELIGMDYNQVEMMGKWLVALADGSPNKLLEYMTQLAEEVGGTMDVQLRPVPEEPDLHLVEDFQSEQDLIDEGAARGYPVQ